MLAMYWLLGEDKKIGSCGYQISTTFGCNMQLCLKQPHLYSIHTVVSTHSKVHRGQTIKNDEDVLVTQLGKAEVETNCSNKGLRYTSHVTPTHVPVNHVDSPSQKYHVTYTYTSHIIPIHAVCDLSETCTIL